LGRFATTAIATNSRPSGEQCPPGNYTKYLSRQARALLRTRSLYQSMGTLYHGFENLSSPKSSFSVAVTRRPKAAPQPFCQKTLFTPPYIILWGKFSKKTSFSLNKSFGRVSGNQNKLTVQPKTLIATCRI
jgi:hypothetical protein